MVASALAAWIVVLTVAGMVVVLAGLTVGTWAVRGLWGAMRGALGPPCGHRGRCSVPEGSGAPFLAPNPQRAADARLRRPSWARTDKETA